jgi:hypothetical protein
MMYYRYGTVRILSSDERSDSWQVSCFSPGGNYTTSCNPVL